MKHRGIAARISLAAVLVGASAALFSAGTAEAKTFVYCSEGSPENFYPAINTTGTSFDASARAIYSRLVEFKAGTTEVGPGLAEKWDVSPDGLTYTFHLRHGVKWQTTKTYKPTHDFNADDVIFSFERQWKTDNAYFKVTSDNHSYFNDMDMPKSLKEIDKVDDYTVKFVLTAPNAPFLANMAMDFASIESKEYADAMLKANTPEKVDQEPVGTGPFILESYQKDAIIRYKANPTFYRGKPKVDTLVFAITPDASVRFQKLKAGECDLIPYPAPADVPAMKADKNLQVWEQAGLNIAYLAFNTSKKPYDDLKVRQAVDMAINKKAIVDAVYLGTGIPAKNPIPPSMWSYNKEVKDYEYNPDQAKKLLADAGLASGFETDLWYMPVQRPYNPNGKRIAELMQADLAKVGIKANLVTYEWGEYRKRLQAGDPMLMQFGWSGDNGDPDNFLYTLLGCAAAKPGGNNVARWCNQDFQAAIEDAQKTPDVKKRTADYEKAQVIFKQQTPWFTIAHSLQIAAAKAGVTGFKLSPLAYHDFSEVDKK
jgi:dipeptide transport system substrate-binding protein